VVEVVALDARALIAASDKGLLRSTDAGASWQVVGLGSARSVEALAASATGTVIAATPLGVFRSLDQGASWTALSSGPDARVLRLAFLPGDDTTLLATTSAGLYKSVDGGRGFFRCYGGLPISEITGLTVHPNGRSVFASDFVRGGLFRSEDGGETWTSLPTDGLRPDRVWSVVIDPDRPESLLAATASGGLHRLGSPPAASAASH